MAALATAGDTDPRMENETTAACGHWQTVAVPRPEYSDDYLDPRLAVFYDQLNSWGPSDEFYLDLAMSARSVLDVGCGTGRLLKRAREVGHSGRLLGLDPAAAMLEQAKSRTDIEWVQGDLGSVSFDHDFELVIMTGHVFQVFITDEAIQTALSGVRSALNDNGRYAFETLNPASRPWERWTGSDKVRAADGAIVTAANTEPRLIAPGVVEVVGRFSSPSWERDVLCPSTFRFVDADALDAFLADADLAVVERYGSWDRRPFSDDSPEIISIVSAAS